MVEALLQKEELLSEDLEAILGKRHGDAPQETGITIAPHDHMPMRED
jgi:hypothetical protein